MPRAKSKLNARRDRAEESVRSFEDKRMQILAEAAKCILRDGVHKAQLQTIADKFQMTRAALYHYVSSKDEIISDCMDIGLTELQKVFTDAQAVEGPGLEKLRYVFHWSPKLTSNDFARVVMQLRENELSAPLRKKLRGMTDYVFSSVQRLAEAGVADKSLRPLDGRMLAMALMTNLSAANSWYDAAKSTKFAGWAPRPTPQDFGDAFFSFLEHPISAGSDGSP